MRKVTILGLYNSMATTIFGPMDILNQAGRLWNRLNKTEHTPFFDVTIASADGQPIRSVNRIEIAPHCGIDRIDATDLIIIASATYIDDILKRAPHLVDWILYHFDRGAHVASICTGVFLLAETGLLDGKSATLHWGFADRFKSRYPQITLEKDRMFIDHGSLYCSAGVTAGMDLSLYLVEKFCGKKAARQSAKTMVLGMDRHSQVPYDSFPGARSHGDTLVTRAQEWLADNRTKTVEYDNLARMLNISRRSLERRFKQATGMTPLAFIQALRVEAAKQMLEDGNLTFSEITYAVGYEDIAFFRKIFVRLTGLRPKEYRQKFSGYTDAYAKSGAYHKA
ncbi:MAG: helix-turn-helix domain-containing protein [Desulfobacterales bacterium]|nr:helix-turn-helix domain-containing protein [Desulfobacterales bacterium]